MSRIYHACSAGCAAHSSLNGRGQKRGGSKKAFSNFLVREEKNLTDPTNSHLAESSESHSVALMQLYIPILTNVRTRFQLFKYVGRGYKLDYSFSESSKYDLVRRCYTGSNLKPVFSSFDNFSGCSTKPLLLCGLG